MNDLKKIAVVGADGKMGKAICQKFEKEFEVFKVTLSNSLEKLTNKNIDLVIDFSVASQSEVSANFCAKNKIPLILGTTGQTKSQLKKIERCGRQTKIVMSSNFSMGICIIKSLLKNLKDSLKNQKCDITIFEKHHSQKIDSPSGTALLLKNEIEQLFDRKNITLNILSERGGKEIGTHTIDIYFGDELISLSHKAFSRQAFCEGVYFTVKNLLQQ